MTAIRLHRYPSPSGGIALGKIGVGATMLKQGKTARDYVQDGLIAMWDGIENAGWGVHDANATTWVDLVGDNDLQVTSAGQWLNNALRTNGTKYGAVGLEMAPEAYECVFCQDNTDLGYYVLLGSTADSRARGFVASTNPISYVATGGTRGLCWPSDIGKFHSYSVNRTPFSFRRDGTIDTGGALGYTSLGSTSVLGIGGRGTSSSGAAATTVCSLRLYSRALSASEIARNYAIDKERFNLP